MVALRERVATLARDGGEVQFEVRIRRGDAETAHLLFDAEAVCEAEGRLALVSGTAQDITQRRHAEAQIRALANYDNLTGLPNRRMFRERPGGRHRSRAWLPARAWRRCSSTSATSSRSTTRRATVPVTSCCAELRSGWGAAFAAVPKAPISSPAWVAADSSSCWPISMTPEQAQRVAERMLESLRQALVIGGRENHQRLGKSPLVTTTAPCRQPAGNTDACAAR